MRNAQTSLIVLAVVFLLSGCTTKTTNTSQIAVPKYDLGTIVTTKDGGKTWEYRKAGSAGKSFLTPDVLAIEIDPSDHQRIYVGTEKDGLFVSNDGGGGWEKLTFPLTKIYGVSAGKSGTLYASGVLNERAKIFKSTDQGSNWKEIYTEPSSGTTITALKSNAADTQIVYAGTIDGMVIKSSDGGATWSNLYKADGPILRIAFDATDQDSLYIGVFGKGIISTRDGGKTFENLKRDLGVFKVGEDVSSLAVDPAKGGVFYAGVSRGIIRGTNFGGTVEALNVLESSKDFPVRAIAINPVNGNEILYNAAQAVYKSVDGGEQWSVNQLEITRSVQTMVYNPSNPQVVYVGLRQIK